MKSKYNDIIFAHYKGNWGNDFEMKRWSLGPMGNLFKDFCVLEYKPNKNREMWTYATCGMSSFNQPDPIELHIFSAKQDEAIVEILTAISYYHKTDTELNLNHTINFGKPWQAQSKCEYGLISLPYLDGPSLEKLIITKSQIIHFYWVIPVMIEEVNYKKLHGVEALEDRFDETKINYLDPNRKSAI